MILDQILIYPLKSGKGCSLSEAIVHPWGLDGDRRWAVVDERGDNLWLGEFPRLASVAAHATAEGGLRLAARGMKPLTVPPAAGAATPVGFSGLDKAVLADDAAHAWFSELLGRPARLVWLDDPGRRSIDPAHGGLPGEVVSFAWDAPLLLISESSALALDGWLAEEAAVRGEDPPGRLSRVRFRPSVIIDGAEAFAEDRWREVRIGAVPFRVSEICDRCAVTTIDPETQETGKEPLRTLARHRKWDGKTWFGIRLVPREPGLIRVGDPISVH
ncbi:MOSC N-terminal beta barrel domain-containing protein [Nonomuraea sp. NPDC005650]|uniref:MOSC domain-containing protein n=1 Tax=Nonomuraea sp. NPDC005650 TaxID=3157045 RepID=UPI0033BF677B